ncbi:MAG: RnfABCDGE type electron transport complex subunit G [Candidatus Woesearchaeota archaeon]|mgnify:FL=1|jgi:electron transport complex protein RnfG|nr:RnfABCDGE type electron transport complex subunit G [Candidatus Woesearchaeota archaeon]MDP7506686.1 RnfABCDGE type electron transport complex subunit G [Candidatus Woesearchaeota archaeon]|tara:strand:- start:1498 stop:2010 length:513 start_codon:yes stop_codon:yes gene_type:complete
MNETIRLTLTLTIICILSAVALSFVYENMNPIIEENKAIRLKAALKEVIPLADNFEEAKEISNPEGIIYIFKGLKDNRIIGYAILSEALGYGGDIKILTGINKDREITGIKIMEHLETPGLGARIEEEEFLDQFIGKPEKIDAITGATISSTAVIDTVEELISSINIEFN